MPRLFKIRKGLNISMAGQAEKIFGTAVSSEVYALKPTDFHGLVPKLEVKEGSTVKAGSPLFTDKNRPRIRFASPVSGTVVAVKRGDRRVILEVVVKADKKIEYEHFTTGDPLQMGRDAIVDNLLMGGLWPMIRQRPYNVIANPEVAPKSVFVSTFDTAPLAQDYSFIVRGSEADFQAGINALSKLTPGKVHLNVNDELPDYQVFTQVKNAQVNYFRGPHPAGNAGVQIQRIDPLNKGEVVWVVSPQDVITIGRLFTRSIYDASKIVALTGSEVLKPCYYRVISGTAMKSITTGRISDTSYRYISGNPLTGKRIEPMGFIGFYDSQVTVIPEGDNFEFLGWAMPGFGKYSFSRSFFSWLNPKKPYVLDTNMHGGHRPFVITGLYEKVFPFDIYPMQLLKAIMAEDIDMMEKLGIYEVAEEDFALCEFVCPSKTEMQVLVRKGLDLMMHEMS